MLAFVPVAFDLYRPLIPRLRWAMQCLVSFADQNGRCFPSIRAFALHAGISKSAAQRDLADLVETGHVTRKRRPGGVYIYQIDTQFLPSWPKKAVSQLRYHKQKAPRGSQTNRPAAGVPERGTEENPRVYKKNQGYARIRARFSKPEMSYDAQPDYDSRWPMRLQSWQKSGFWLPVWGAKPNEPGPPQQG